jgi:mRNA-degrading endonuclease toxin of MazEF toxin-antitoxin module
MAMAKTTPLEFGRIVWAEVPDANGIRKLRPAVIVTNSDRIATDRTLELVAITSRISEPLPDDHVLLPWHAQRHPRTGLNRKCAAVCSWLCTIAPADVKDTAGLVPGAVLLQIMAKIEEINAPHWKPPAGG